MNIKKTLKVYIPHEIKGSLIWFVLASIVGIIIQSAEAGKFVFADFFYKNYIFTIKTIYEGFSAVVLIAGFGVVIATLIQLFYYVIMTYCAVRIVYYLLSTLNKRNTQKLIIYIIIIVGVVILFQYYQSDKIPLFTQCSKNIIPQKLNVKLCSLVKEGNGAAFGRTMEIAAYNSWVDGSKIEVVPNTYNRGSCKQGTEGQNVNYFYCGDFIYRANNKNYIIDLVIKPEGTVQCTYLNNEMQVSSSGESSIINPNQNSKEVYLNYTVVSSTCKKPEN